MTSKRNQFFAQSLKSNVPRSRRLGRLELLEARDLMHGSGFELHECHCLPDVGDDHPGDYVAYIGPTAQGGASAQGGSGSYLFLTTSRSKESKTKITDPRTADQQAGLPLLDSNPGAPVTLYLDFNGDFISDWWYNDGSTAVHYYNVSTPAFDFDGNAAKFSTAEADFIREVWARVAEDYSPFNINVSTAYYGGFANGQALKVAIGGSNTTWLGADNSGFASIGSFADNAPNQVFVFDLAAWAQAGVTDGDGNPLNGAAAIATTASHEAGHAFGLRHHARYTFEGTKMTDYDPGTNGWTPIMGDNLAGDRTTWDAGPTDLGAATFQDDVAVLARPINAFGFRPDDYSNSRSTAYALLSNEVGVYTGKGIIEQRLDYDVFTFTTSGGAVSIVVNAAKLGPNLIPVAELYSTTGFVSSATGGSWTQSIITKTLPAGTYYLQVRGFGDHGSMGQYTFSISTELFTGPLLTTSSTTVDSTKETTTTTTSSPLLTKSTSTTDVKTSGGAGAGSSAMIGETSTTAITDTKPAKPNTAAAVHDAIFAQWDGDQFATPLGRKGKKV